MNAPENQLDAAVEQLTEVCALLQSAQKILRRDWEQMSPRERSEQSRQVKLLETRQAALHEEIELKSSELNRLV